MKEIASLNNAVVKAVSELKQKKYRERENCFVVEGLRAAEEAINYAEVRKIFSVADKNNARLQKLLADAEAKGIELYSVTEAVMKKMSDTEAPQGVLAVQMPDNWLEPTHVLMREVAWEQNYPDRGREPLAGVHAYYDILSEAGCEVDIWRTTYYHQMPSHQAIIDWVTATGLRPWLQDLTESEQQLFLKRYHQMLEEQYPLQENGQILLAFPRLFIVARRTE